MFNFFLFNCCQNGSQNEAEFDLDIRNTVTHANSLEDEIKKLKLSLKDKLCLFTIYSHSKELFPLNELKNDEEAENILNQKYFEIYRRQNNILSLSLIKKFNLQNNSLVDIQPRISDENLENILEIIKNKIEFIIKYFKEFFDHKNMLEIEAMSDYFKEIIILLYFCFLECNIIISFL